MKDALGNDVKVGDLVAVRLEQPVIFGQIVELGEGAVLPSPILPETGLMFWGSTGIGTVRPGRVVIMSRHHPNQLHRVELDHTPQD